MEIDINDIINHNNEINRNIQKLETLHREDFFRLANILFEKLAEQYRIKDNHQYYLERLHGICNALNSTIPCIESIREFLITLNKYKRHLSHNFELDIELDEQKIIMKKQLEDIFRCVFSIDKDIIITKSLVIKNMLQFLNYIPHKSLEKIKKDLQNNENDELKVYDLYLHLGVITIYSISAGTLYGIMKGQRARVNNHTKVID